jgi:hypothetical protein
MTEPDVTFTDQQKQTLRDVARGSIAHGLSHGSPMPVKPSDYPPALQQRFAVFVTLHLEDQLRGCIGNTEPVASLVEDTSRNAFAAAFQDPRFGPVTQHEYARLDLKLSILTPPVPLHASSEDELIAKLRPGEDGLVLTAGHRRSTFLPAVWDMLEEPRRFLAHLKMKAGLAPDAWPDDLRFQRYTAISV